MGQIIEVPFNSGQDESIDRSLLPDKLLRSAQNCRLSRDGRLEVRPSFTALSTATMNSGTITAYDVANFGGRLVALGDTFALSRPTDLFEWNARASKWRQTAGDSTSSTTGPRLPQLTDIRGIGALPDQFLAVDSVKLACGAGFVAAVINYGTTIGSVLHIFDPATDQTLFCAATALKLATVTFAGTKFWVVGADVNDDAGFYGFDPLVDESLPSLTVDTALTSIIDVAACTFGTGWAYAAAHSAGVTAKTKTSAGVAGVTIAVTATASDCVALAGNTLGTALTAVTRANVGGAVTANTYSAAGALAAGPTTVFATTTVPRLGACVTSTGATAVRVVATNGSDSLTRTLGQAAHATSAVQTYFDARVEIAPVTASGRQFAGFVDREADQDNVGTYHLAELDNFLPQAFLQPQLADPGGAGFNHISTPAVNGTLLYFPVLTILQDLGTGTRKARFNVYEAETSGLPRRQMAQLGGELLIAGGLPLTYDGRALSEQGFAERPTIDSSTAGAAGSLTLLGVYNAIPLWEVFDGKGRLVRSQAGSPATRTLTGVNNDITWTVTTPHSLRRHPAFRNQAFSIRVSIYRTEAGEGVFFLDKQITIDPLDDPAELVTLQSTQSDTNLIDNAVLYEQSQTPISHVAPPPYRFAAAARERAFIAGLPEVEGWATSKQLFPAEPVEYAPAGQLGYSGRVGQPITAVAGFPTSRVVFTAQEIWTIPGRGPERNGVGEFDAATAVATPGGALDWRSVIVTPIGAFFQMRADRLMLLGPDGAVSWFGAPVQDTLALFPTIVGSMYVRELDLVVFACNNLAGNAGVFISYDLQAEAWFVDTLDTAITSVSELDGRLVYVASGTVFQQNATVGSGAGALPAFRVDTGTFRPFSALGYGDILRIGILGTYLGDATVDVSISYDDGKTWTSMGAQAVTAAAWTNAQTGLAIAAGDPITLLYTPKVRTTDRFSIRIEQSAATNTGGIRMHVLSFEVEAQSGTVRRAARDQR